MTIQSILLPVFVQVALTFLLLFAMGGLRIAALRGGSVRSADAAVGQAVWPGRAAQVGRAFQNQFELPLLFYVLVVLAILTRKADAVIVTIEWLFVLSRLAHAAIHTSANNLTLRFSAFAFGALVLLVGWIVLAVGVLAAAP